jgi:hypothetical protein
MAQPKWLDKYLTMKPEVSKLFDDLEAWHDQCRFEMIDFNPADLYKSKAYKDWQYKKNGGKNFRNSRDGNAKFYNKPRYNDNFSR